MPILMTINSYSLAVLCGLLLILNTVFFQNPVAYWLLTAVFFLGLYRVYKHHKLGGFANYKGYSMYEMVYKK